MLLSTARRLRTCMHVSYTAANTKYAKTNQTTTTEPSVFIRRTSACSMQHSREYYIRRICSTAQPQPQQTRAERNINTEESNGEMCAERHAVGDYDHARGQQSCARMHKSHARNAHVRVNTRAQGESVSPSAERRKSRMLCTVLDLATARNVQWRARRNDVIFFRSLRLHATICYDIPAAAHYTADSSRIHKIPIIVLLIMCALCAYMLRLLLAIGPEFGSTQLSALNSTE